MSGLTLVAEHVRPVASAHERLLPVDDGLSALLPDAGLRRGTTIAVEGSTSLLLRLIAPAVRSGAWAAVAGMPDLGVVAAHEAGIALERLALVPHPGREWSTVVGALIDGVEVVVGQPPPHVRAGDARRLSARTRERGGLLVLAGESRRWPERVDLKLSVGASRWTGLGDGHGHLAAHEVEIAVTGRGRSGGRGAGATTAGAKPTLLVSA